MDENNTVNKPDAIEVTLESTEYTIASGTSVEIVFFIANITSTGDYYKFSILGIAPNWITYPNLPAVWVPAGGRERVSLSIHPPATAETVPGLFPGRLHVFSQSVPENEKVLEFLLKVLPEEKPKGVIQLRPEISEIKAAPGTAVKIPLVISNLSQASEFLVLSVQGVPTTWISLPSPVVTLYGGEEKRIEVILQIPSTPEIRAGYFPVTISALSQKDPTIKAETGVKLGISAFESHGRVGVMMSSVQFSTAPGSSLNVPITVLNRGLESDTFRLGIDGVPVNWVSTSAPVISLEPGENKEISLVVRPPISPTSQAGRYKFQVIVASQKTPDQVVRVDCILTMSAYTQFSTELEPREAQAGELISVSVKNDGNTQQVFHITCASKNDQLLFEFQPPIKFATPGSITQQGANTAAGGQPSASPYSQPQPPKQPAGQPGRRV